jgi:hypothetical protein
MELGFLRRRNDLEILQAREMAQLEVMVPASVAFRVRFRVANFPRH